MTSLLRTELRKLRFTRSLWALPAGGALLSIVGSALVIAFFKEQDIAVRLSEHGPLRFGPTNVGLILLIFGIRVFADETHHHTLASTYLASPNRRAVLVAKATVASAVALAFCVAVFAFVVPITLVGVSARDLPMTMDTGETAALFIRTSVAMTFMTVLGGALAAIVRNRAVVLVTCLVWLALLENIMGGLVKAPALMPGAAVRALVDGDGGGDALTATAAAVLLVGVVGAALCVAVARLRHDVS